MFPLRPEKLREAVGFLLSLESSSRMNYTKLIKLLYIADRESLGETGEPITGDETWALPKGPILSHVMDLIRKKVTAPDWARLFRTEGTDLVVISDPGCMNLCAAETDKLREVHWRHRRDDFRAMIRETHKLPEYKKNEVRSGRKRIPLRDILEALGIADQAAIIEDAAVSAARYAALCRR